MKGRFWPGGWLLLWKWVVWKRTGTSRRIWVYGAELEKRRDGYGNGKVVHANEKGESESGLWSEQMGLMASQFQWFVDES